MESLTMRDMILSPSKNLIDAVQARQNPIKKAKQATCNCDAYHFPHREGGGACGDETDTSYQTEINEREESAQYWENQRGYGNE